MIGEDVKLLVELWMIMKRREKRMEALMMSHKRKRVRA